LDLKNMLLTSAKFWKRFQFYAPLAFAY
jgi:hypothetical protein